MIGEGPAGRISPCPPASATHGCSPPACLASLRNAFMTPVQLVVFKRA